MEKKEVKRIIEEKIVELCDLKNEDGSQESYLKKEILKKELQLTILKYTDNKTLDAEDLLEIGNFILKKVLERGENLLNGNI